MSNPPLVDPARIRLDLAAPDRAAAVRAVAELLSDDPRVGGWDEFWTSIGGRQVVDLEGCSDGVILAHGRADSVKSLAVAAARWKSPEGPRLVFVFAIPSAMSGEYLRRVGALARVCRDSSRLTELFAAPSPAGFAAKLEAWLD